MSEFYGVADEKDSIRTIHRALDLGVNLLDTADMYGLGRNEELVGKAIDAKRRDFVVATKFGIVRDESGQRLGVCGKPEHVRTSCENSLRRMNIDEIDLYYQHRVDQEVPIEDTVGEMSRLVEEGKVLYIGLSEAGPDNIRRAFSVHPVSALQTEYSLWTRDPEREVIPTCRELGIGFVPYSPLGRALLAGKSMDPGEFQKEGDSRLTRFPRYQGENFEKNIRLVRGLLEAADQLNCTAAQLALAWILVQGEDLVPIPGTTKIRHLEENIASLEIELSDEDLAELSRLFPPGAAAGDRYFEAGMQLLDT
jgi:aryl-alcohol dehydrogenase-like predicted oxidoreductase